MHAAALRILQNKEESLVELKERMNARRHAVALMHRNLGAGAGAEGRAVNEPQSLMATGEVGCECFFFDSSCFFVVFKWQ
jgi:hypothetical protein